MGTIKDRNGKDLRKEEDIRKRWQEYTEKLYKKYLHNPDNHDGVVTHLDPDILVCEVKWALGTITMNKANGGDGIPAELFQVLKDDAVQALHSVCQQIWKTQQGPQIYITSVFIPVCKKSNAKEYSNYCTVELISHATKVMLKILQARLQQYVNQELPNVQLDLEKAEEPEIKLPTSIGSQKKQGNFQKQTSTSASLTTLKPLTEWIITDCGKFLKRWEYQITLPASWEICIHVKKQQLEPDMEQRTGSKLGKEYVKAVYGHPAYLAYMQSTSWEMLAWTILKLESRLPGEISITSDMQMTPV